MDSSQKNMAPYTKEAKIPAFELSLMPLCENLCTYVPYTIITLLTCVSHYRYALCAYVPYAVTYLCTHAPYIFTNLCTYVPFYFYFYFYYYALCTYVPYTVTNLYTCVPLHFTILHCACTCRITASNYRCLVLLLTITTIFVKHLSYLILSYLLTNHY